MSDAFDPERGNFAPPPSQFRNASINSVAPSSVFSSLAAFFGLQNLFSRHVSGETMVWLFNNTAFRDPDTGKWVAEFVAAFFTRDSGRDVSLVVAYIAEQLGIGKGSRDRKTIAKRVDLFARYIEPGKKVTIDFGGREDLVLGPSGRNGISSQVLRIPGRSRYKEGSFARSRAIVNDDDNHKIPEMKTEFAEPTGWGFISGMSPPLPYFRSSAKLDLNQRYRRLN